MDTLREHADLATRQGQRLLHFDISNWNADLVGLLDHWLLLVYDLVRAARQESISDPLVAATLSQMILTRDAVREKRERVIHFVAKQTK